MRYVYPLVAEVIIDSRDGKDCCDIDRMEGQSHWKDDDFSTNSIKYC
jgi:hypothetical protein